MNKKEILGLCEFLKLHGYENTDNISKFIFGLQQENNQLKEELKATKEVAEEHLKKEIQYKEVIEEVREYIKDNYDDYEEFIYGKEFKNKLLQILDKGESNE